MEMNRNSQFTGEFTYEIDSASDDDYTEDYVENNKRTSGFQKRYPSLVQITRQAISLSFLFSEYQK